MRVRLLIAGPLGIAAVFCTHLAAAKDPIASEDLAASTAPRFSVDVDGGAFVGWLINIPLSGVEMNAGVELELKRRIAVVGELFFAGAQTQAGLPANWAVHV